MGIGTSVTHTRSSSLCSCGQASVNTPHQTDPLATISIKEVPSDALESTEPTPTRACSDFPWYTVFLVQIPCIVTTLGLLGVYCKGFAWSPTPDQVTLLLVGAKLYEFSVIGSLSSILFHRIRSTLQSSHGVPLGFLASPFQLNTPLYPFSRQFWAAATGSCKGSQGDHTTLVYVVSSIVVAILAGPSASTIMLPKVDWWPIKDNVIPSELRSHPLLINATFEALYPKLVDASASLDFCNAAASRTENITAALIALCPFGGLPDILDSFQELLNIDSDRGFATNITVTAPHHVRDVSVGWKLGQRQHGESAVAYATTASDFVVKELREQGRGIKPHVQVRMKTQAVSTSYRMTEAPDGDHGTQTVLTTSGRPWRQPAVAVQCAPVREDAGRKAVQFGAGPYKAALDLTADVEKLTQAHQDDEDLHFIDLTSSALGPVSASVIHRTGNSQRLCIAIARWVDSDVSSFVSSGDPPSTMVPVQPGASPEGLFLDKNEVLQMSTDWTRLLSNPVFTQTSDQPRNRTTTAFDEFYNLCSKSVDSSSRCLAIGMSLYLTDALARLQYSWDTFRCDLDPLALSGGQKTSCMQHRASTEEVPITVHLGMEEFLRVTGVSSSYFQRKSAYGLQGFSVSMAFALLIFHVVVILAHWMEHFVRKRTYRTRGWADVGELVALAMRADHFDVLAPGQSMLADGETWRLRTFVREKKSTGSADIMLKPKTTRLRSAAPNKIPPVSIWRESTICSERRASCESLAEAKHKEMDIC